MNPDRRSLVPPLSSCRKPRSNTAPARADPAPAVYPAGRWQIIKRLNEVLATEIIGAQRHQCHDLFVNRLHAHAAAAQVLRHAGEEQARIKRIIERITQLEGTPNFSPEALSDRSASDCTAHDDPVSMLEEDLMAERIAIQSLREMIHDIGASDPATRRLLEDLQAQEEAHAGDMSALLQTLHK